MKFYRCLICGESYGGKEAPTHCPFCGVPSKFLVEAKQWVDENLVVGELSEVSRANLQIALQLEANNSPFYRDAARRTASVELQGIFQYLSKIEAAHAFSIRRVLNVDVPKPEAGRDRATDDDKANVAEAHERETKATAFYKKAAAEAEEQRVRKLFGALAAVEADHIQLEVELLARI